LHDEWTHATTSPVVKIQQKTLLPEKKQGTNRPALAAGQKAAATCARQHTTLSFPRRRSSSK